MLSRRPRLGVLGLGLIAITAGCRTTEDAAESLATAAIQPKIGILLASHGDIDDTDSELEDYIKVSFQKNVGIPLPNWSRGILTDPAYRLSVKTVRDQYDIIGPTRYRENSQKQVDAVNQALKKVKLNARAYMGFNFTKPFIDETMATMRQDGIDTIIVFNKGAQFSYASSGENMEDALTYLNNHPDYDARVIGYRQYSDDERFIDVMTKAIKKDAKTLFPGVAAKDICILLGSHGLPTWLIDKGDPAIEQMRAAVKTLREKLSDYRVYHGYLNDDFFPGASWVGPKAVQVAPDLVKDRCENVLLDGRLSFTTHHRATLYDMNYEIRNILEKQPLARGGAIDRSWRKPKVVLAPNFDSDPNFASLIVQLTQEAIAGKGPIVKLKEPQQKPLKKGSVGKPCVKVD